MDTDSNSTHIYSREETEGMIALTTAGGLSFLFIVLLLIAMIVSMRRSRKTEDSSPHQFMKTHVGIYFLCLLTCDFAQAIGSIISITWIVEGAVRPGTTCTSQAIFYQIGNVGSALWSLTIAVHTFSLLFLRIQVSSIACLSTFIGVWFAIGAIVAVGPTLIQNTNQGPFHGPSGPWCWITEDYGGSRLGLEYFWMFFSAFVSFVLYTLVFLSLRGNIVVSGWSISFRCVERSRAWNGSAGRETVESHVLSVARQMLWYPVAYTVLILPIAVCRWTEFSGKEMPLSAIFATDCIFLLSGAVNVVLFTTTRRVIPERNSLPVHTQSTKDVVSFVSSAAMHATGRPVEPDSPSTEDGFEDRRSQDFEKPEYSYAPSFARPASQARWQTRKPTDNHLGPRQDRYFFTPSSLELRSSQSMAFSDNDSYQSYQIPIHLQPIPVVITTPPSPTPSQRSRLSVITSDTSRERNIAQARDMLPALTRF